METSPAGVMAGLSAVMPQISGTCGIPLHWEAAVSFRGGFSSGGVSLLISWHPPKAPQKPREKKRKKRSPASAAASLARAEAHRRRREEQRTQREEQPAAEAPHARAPPTSSSAAITSTSPDSAPMEVLQPPPQEIARGEIGEQQLMVAAAQSMGLSTSQFQSMFFGALAEAERYYIRAGRSTDGALQLVSAEEHVTPQTAPFWRELFEISHKKLNKKHELNRGDQG